MFGAAYTSYHLGQLQLLFITMWSRVLFLEADSFSAIQNFSTISYSVDVHLQCSKELPLVHILIDMDPVHILPSMPRSPKWSLSGFPTKNVCAFLFSPICATYPTHFILLYLIIQIIFSSVSCFFPSLLWPNIFTPSCSWLPSAAIVPSMWKTKLHIRTKQQTKL